MNALDDWVNARRDTLTWLDCDRYVWSVFAGAPERWYDDPATLAAATAQAQRLLRSDVHGVDIVGPFSRHLAASGDAAAICAVLRLDEPRRLLAETVDALLHQLDDRVDIVLNCPSPRRLLAAGPGAGFDELDDVAAGLLEVIRTLADRPIRGLQITCDPALAPDEDECDSWASLLAAAEHYRWVTAIRLDGVTDPGRLDGELPGQLLLCPRASADVIPDDRRHGGGLAPCVWTDSSEADQLADAAGKRGFRFGEIPFDASPEIVLARLTTLATVNSGGT
jgi:hypothetical protein